MAGGSQVLLPLDGRKRILLPASRACHCILQGQIKYMYGVPQLEFKLLVGAEYPALDSS